jgi:hypothetical protein
MALGSKTIQDRSERKFRSAIDRLRNGVGTHKDHGKGNVLITISAVAQEAEMGRSTLHRYPHLCSEIRQLGSLAHGHAAVRTNRSASRSLTNTINDLRVQIFQIRTLKMQLSQAQEQKIELLVELDKVQRQRPKVVPLKA